MSLRLAFWISWAGTAVETGLQVRLPNDVLRFQSTYRYTGPCMYDRKLCGRELNATIIFCFGVSLLYSLRKWLSLFRAHGDQITLVE